MVHFYPNRYKQTSLKKSCLDISILWHVYFKLGSGKPLKFIILFKLSVLLILRPRLPVFWSLHQFNHLSKLSWKFWKMVRCCKSLALQKLCNYLIQSDNFLAQAFCWTHRYNRHFRRISLAKKTWFATNSKFCWMISLWFSSQLLHCKSEATP